MTNAIEEETKTADNNTSSGNGSVEQWDLTSRVSPYLDRHMMFPLLEHLDRLINAGTISYSTNDIAAARLALLRPTHMVDYAIDTYKGLHSTEVVPAEMKAQKDEVYSQLNKLSEGSKPFSDLCSNQEERAKLVSNGQWNVSALSEISELNLTAKVVDDYREHAKFMFDCGDYKSARDMLENYLSLFASPPAEKNPDDDDELAGDNKDNKKTEDQNTNIGNPSIYYLTQVTPELLEVLWGKLACEILVLDWEAASVAVEAVKNAMELLVQSNQMTSLKALEQRTWLLHWSLFVYWHDTGPKGGLEHLVDLFHSEKYRQAITTNAPHLLRYLTASVLLCKRRVTKKAMAGSYNAEARRLMKNLINVMNDCEYTDPIVEFVNCLCVKFDFDSAQTKLNECKDVLGSDFFLVNQTDLFMEEARVFVFENYCRIHNKIDLSALGEKLAMDQNQAERWIVDLIRNADLDAKIDSEQKCVVMSGNDQSIYEQVMDRTRELNVRSATLVQNLNSMLNEARKEKAKKLRAASRDD